MAVSQLTVLQDLPLFSGNARSNKDFTPDIDASTFMRAVENHKNQQGITSDEKKLQLFFSLIDKKRGDAIQLITCYTKRKGIKWCEFRQEFLSYYPSFKIEEFQSAAQSLLNTSLTNDTTLCAMTNLENATRAVVEAYLKNESLIKGEFGLESKVPLLSPAQQAASSQTTQATTASTMLLIDIIQNFVLQLFVANHAPTKVCDKISHYGPQNTSTKFMAETVHATERHLSVNRKGTHPRRNETIWKSTQIPRQEKGPTKVTSTKTPAPSKPSYHLIHEQRNKTSMSCYRCGEEGHFKRECDKCGYCRGTGYSAKNCRRRIREARGKYCEHCKIADSHNTYECQKRDKQAVRNKVHLANERIPYDSEDTESKDEQLDSQTLSQRI